MKTTSLMFHLAIMAFLLGGSSAGAQSASDYDTAFAPPDGYRFFLLDENQNVSDIVADPLGRIVVVGEQYLSSGANSRVFVARFTATGAFDTTFGTGGIFEVPSDIDRTLSWEAVDVALASDGKIYISFPGKGGLNQDYDFYLARVLADGSGLDPAFGSSGRATAAFDLDNGSGEDFPSDLVVQSDGKIVVVGQVDAVGGADKDFGIARFTDAGLLDTGFSTDGKAVAFFDIGGDDDDTPLGVTMMGSQVVVVGQAQTATGFDVAVTVLTGSGAVDTSFASIGRATYAYTDQALTAIDNRAHAVTYAFIPGFVGLGSILVGAGTTDPAFIGSPTVDMAVLCLDIYGTSCSGFGNGGWALVDFSDNGPFGIGDTDDQVGAILYDWQTDRVTLVGGATEVVGSGDTYNAVARLDADMGVLDPTFGNGGKRYYTEQSQGAAGTVAGDLDPSNRIVMGIGTYSYSSLNNDIWVCRLQSPALLFTDGFEIGTTGAWSDVSP